VSSSPCGRLWLCQLSSPSWTFYLAKRVLTATLLETTISTHTTSGLPPSFSRLNRPHIILCADAPPAHWIAPLHGLRHVAVAATLTIAVDVAVAVAAAITCGPQPRSQAVGAVAMAASGHDVFEAVHENIALQVLDLFHLLAHSSQILGQPLVAS
jgi:hypothetical protein